MPDSPPVPAILAEPALDTGIATLEVRGARVVLDRDLARLFGVETRRLNEQLRRNLSRFDGYAFQLSDVEVAHLMSQFATSSSGWGGLRKRPWAFTEHGVVMAATILNSEAAITAMRLVVEVFVAARRAGALPVAATGLGPRLQRTLERLLDTVVDQRGQTTVREEAQALIAQSIQHLKDRLGRPGLENEELAARATKLLAEAELAKATAAKSQAEASEIEFRLLARRLRLVIEAERAFAAGQTDAFLAVLEDLGRGG
ncbi:MAG: ORF6N domain-containing protein [Alphaproteobacteria bacterium]|nr:ORF6N domain-containing protein [Alphaproteobacteria bacterium]MBU1516520.1 ORF6N domain-containing protein [Alphaproteobacteria bacterium]MBU2094277.1 ORF6N domain-containing protein [Alphaproteobacteria bacterium]MBU2154146.1 ORF6N domain-containing protein [Alphaproteobacteria bacterium]MBU2307447.1 ORF6N domain-containing protein [Alphaproteobacteria bacterium]